MSCSIDPRRVSAYVGLFAAGAWALPAVAMGPSEPVCEVDQRQQQAIAIAAKKQRQAVAQSVAEGIGRAPRSSETACLDNLLGVDVFAIAQDPSDVAAAGVDEAVGQLKDQVCSAIQDTWNSGVQALRTDITIPYVGRLTLSPTSNWRASDSDIIELSGDSFKAGVAEGLPADSAGFGGNFSIGNWDLPAEAYENARDAVTQDLTESIGELPF